MTRGAQRMRALIAPLLAAGLTAALLTACGVVHQAGTWNGTSGTAPAGSGDGSTAATAGADGGSGAKQVPAYDISPLLQPKQKYLGLEIPGAPDSLAPVKQFAGWTGHHPSLVGQYVAWNSSFDTAAAANAWSYGALLYMVWEPWNTTESDIAAGKSDSYITNVATAIRAFNKPIALSFGHEMNGNWYPWGTKDTTAAQFVAAWRHIHDLFVLAGATNVIWVWNPNDIYPVQSVALQPYYPGDAYVDWVGVTGYWTPNGPHTYASLYLPTLLQVRKFSAKPFLIAETSAEPDTDDVTWINSLFQAVETHSDIVGFVWYDYDRNGDWRIENRPQALAAFRADAANPDFALSLNPSGQ